MSDPAEDAVYDGQPTDPVDLYWLDLRNEQVKQTVPRLNDAIARLLVLSTGLAGGSLAFLKDDVSTAWGRVLAAALFFVALAVCVVGTVPVARRGEYEPDGFRVNLEAAIRRKRQLLWAAAGCLMAGFAVAILGAACRAFG